MTRSKWKVFRYYLALITGGVAAIAFTLILCAELAR